MSLFLKNYTSDVPVSQTIARIESVLIRCGVSGIMKEYRPNPPGAIAAITFQIKCGNEVPTTIRLPADEEAATEALWREYVGADVISKDGQEIWSNNRKKLKRKDFIQQGARTAWKLMQDWVEVQMSLIQLKQAQFDQVFMPYIWDGRRGQSFYQICKADGFKALLPERAGE